MDQRHAYAGSDRGGEGRRRIEKGTGGGDELGVAGGGLALLEPLVVGQLIRLHALGAVPAAGQEGRMECKVSCQGGSRQGMRR